MVISLSIVALFAMSLSIIIIGAIQRAKTFFNELIENILSPNYLFNVHFFKAAYFSAFYHVAKIPRSTRD